MRIHATAFLMAILAASTPMAAESEAAAVSFEMHRAGTYRGESCGTGDFNNDGRLDIAALPYLYLAPEFTPVKICEVKGEVDEEGKGYRWDFMNAPLDVDGDGWLDIATCSWFGKKAEWLRNPGPDGGEWARTLIEENGNYECGDLWDLDGDGAADEILPAVTNTIWYEAAPGPDGKQRMVKHVISEETMAWGVGCGDVNGDGRADVLRPNAWFEAPENPRNGAWKKHPLAIGHPEEGKAEHTPQIWTYDVNRDGLADIVTSCAHGTGIFWYAQHRDTGSGIRWKQHVIDDSWTQAHSITLADMDNDGDKDLVAGKRFMSHNGHDPGAFQPLCVYWYELTPGPEPEWKRHTVTAGEGIGSGLNLPVVDLDGDGDQDIIVTGKWGGPVWFENLLR